MRDEIIKRNLVITIISLLVFFFLSLYINSSSNRRNVQNDLINISNIMNKQIANDVTNYETIINSFTGEQDWLKVVVTNSLGSFVYDSTNDTPLEYSKNNLTENELKIANSNESNDNRVYINDKEMYFITIVTQDIIVRTSITLDSNESYILNSAFYMLLLITITLFFGIIYSRKTSYMVEEAFQSISSNLKTINSGTYETIDTNHKFPEVREALKNINDISNSIYQYIINISKERDKVNYIVNNMSQGLMIINKNEEVLIINKYAMDAFNLDKDYQGKKFNEIFNDERIDKKVFSIINSHNNITLDYFDEDSRKIYSFMISYLDDEWQSGDLNKGLIFISIIDVTEERRNDDVKVEFIANASHELKTPITSISGFSELLLNGFGSCDDKAKNYIKRIHEESLRMKDTIDELLYLSNLENHSLLIELTEEIYLDELIVDIIDQYQSIANKANVFLTYKVFPVVILGSNSLIRHLISNLVENAIKYNKENGSVNVFIEDQGTYINLKVSDTGIGIDPINYDKLFDRFYRIESSRNRSTGGTGLGLTICKKICLAHETSINVDSKIGEGTTFSIRFDKYIK